MSNFGWTYLSRDALRKAQAQLQGEAENVRDEVGFLRLHQGYADRFFPGTSVLHSRLRYMLFVPWMYEDIRKKAKSSRIDKAVETAECAIVPRLSDAGKGVIGSVVHPEPSSQPPSVVYWSALAKWGVLRTALDGRPAYTRRELHSMLSKGGSSSDEDGQPIRDVEAPFVPLPNPPASWSNSEKLSFQLTAGEGSFVRTLWSAVACPSEPQRPSFLARLAQHKGQLGENCWDEQTQRVAGPDRDALARASSASSLSAIGRAVYAALVETTWAKGEPDSVPRTHRDYLSVVLKEHRAAASRFDLEAVLSDIGAVSLPFQTVLEDTVKWVTKGGVSCEALYDSYAVAEARKGSRARLARSVAGTERRVEWGKADYPLAQPLKYRWDNVRQLLEDLRTAS